MENSKKTVKVLSYIFYVLAVFDLILVGFAIMVLCGANVNASLLGVSPDAVKTAFVGLTIAYVVDFIFTVYLAAKGIRVSNGTIKGTAHITLSLVLLILELIGVVVNIYLLVTGQGNSTQLIAGIISTVCLYLYYTNCKKVAA